MNDLYGEAHTDLSVSDPEFAAIKARLIYGEVYAEETLPAKLREPVILAVAAANQTMNEVQRQPPRLSLRAENRRRSRRPSITARPTSASARQRMR